MNIFGPAILAFVIAAAISVSELITAKYPRTFFLLRKNHKLYLYALTYGAVAFGIMLGLRALVTAETVKLEGLGLSLPWVQAIAVGLTTKAFLHINLFNVTVGSQPMPVGLETLVQLFEPALLRTILLDEFNAVRNYAQPHADKHSNLPDDKGKIKRNIPSTLPAQERAAFESDLDKTDTVIDAMELFLRFVGRATFNRVFPL